MVTAVSLTDIEHLRRSWGWLLALGIVLIALGIIALAFIPAATLASVLALGWLMVFSGFFEAIYAVRARHWGGVFLHMIAAAPGVLIGLLVVTHPVAGALAWTMLFAAFLTVIGLFRTVAAVQVPFS